MTVFDRLEAQLLDAHERRSRRALPRPRARHAIVFAAAVAAAVAIFVAGLAASSGTSSPQPGTSGPPVVPAKTEVSVLNSSRTPGRAGRVAMDLADRGWKIGAVTNGPDQSLDSSRVDFTPGNSEAASIIAKQLGVHNVLPASDDLRTVAGHSADVIVVIGADRILER
jgi:hypothetical protein